MMKVRPRVTWLALAVAVLATGCGSGTSVFTMNNEVSAIARLTGVRHTQHGDMITGVLKIEGSGRKLVSADLECFWLHIGARKSQSIWVDQFIDVQRGDYPASNGVVNVGVYWAMPDDMKLTEADFRDANMTIENPFLSPSCFEFT